MTSTVNALTHTFLDSSRYDSLALAVDAIAVALLIVLLIEQELLRVYFAEADGIRLRVFRVAVFPLLAAFVFVVGLRASGVR